MAFLYADVFGKAFVPKKLRPHLRFFFSKAGYSEVPYALFGWIFYLSQIFTYFTFFLFIYRRIMLLPKLQFVIATFFSWFGISLFYIALMSLAFYLYLDTKIYFRKQEIERYLPDYLELVSANLRGGMNFEQALWSAIHPEFGILAQEMGIVAKKVTVGYDLDIVLLEFAEKYQSKVLRRAFELIISEIKTGGKIEKILEGVVEDLRSSAELREELAASTLSYIIFIAVSVMFISPALFALSYHLIAIISSITSNLATSNLPTTSTLGFGANLGNFSKVNIDLQTYKGFSILLLTIISFTSGILISIIRHNNFKESFKYIPLLVITSIIFYFLVLGALNNVFGTLVAGQ